ncbi:lipase-like isoform X2 [Folsomia candida]|uniref:lipase-like isoform X2 n=1 Tax=Folsomia candida TaxID=158441 RepID=UPI001605361B|nr:lipase-like isoform X2 [Folsomia candida]
MNWIMDSILLPTGVSNGGIKVHLGFFLSLMSIYNPVVKQVGIYLARSPGSRIVVNGHSLGGSMASLLVYFMTSLNQFPFTNYALVTSGQPRTGNVKYADYMNFLNIPMNRVVARRRFINRGDKSKLMHQANVRRHLKNSTTSHVFDTVKFRLCGGGVHCIDGGGEADETIVVVVVHGNKLRLGGKVRFGETKSGQVLLHVSRYRQSTRCRWSLLFLLIYHTYTYLVYLYV